MSSSPVAALWRLRPYLRPYRFQLIAMIVAALAAEGAEVAIPLLVKAVIDGAVAHHEREPADTRSASPRSPSAWRPPC